MYIYIYILYICIYLCMYVWLLGLTTKVSLHYLCAFYPSSLKILLLCICTDLSSVESVTAWYWASCYLQISKDIYLWYGTAVNLFVQHWCGVQFTNWKIMRAIMANHSLKFKCWAFFQLECEWNDMKKIFKYYLIILTHLIIWKSCCWFMACMW